MKMHRKMTQNLLGFWANLFVVQSYRVRRAFRACATLVEHGSPRKCEASAPCMYSRRSLQSGGILTVEEGRHMVRQNDDERAKAERLLKRLEEKDSKMRKKWVDASCRC
jgi:hypothetical protein